MGWGPWPAEPFLDDLRRHADASGVSCVVCTYDNVDQIIRASESGRRRILVYLDTGAAYDDPSEPYYRLSFTAKDGGALVISEPDHAKQGVNKAVFQGRFQVM